MSFETTTHFLLFLNLIFFSKKPIFWDLIFKKNVMKTSKFKYQKMPKYRGKLRNFIESSSKNIGGKSEIMCLKRSEKSSKFSTFKTFRRNPRYSYNVLMLKGHKVENNISHLIFQGQDDFQLELCTITLGMDHTSDF